MLNVIRAFWIVFILINLSACSSIKVSQDYDQEYDFSGLKTFAWKPNPNKEYGLTENQLVDERIRNAIVKNLKSKQFSQVETSQADFYISYHLTVEQKVSTSNVSGGVSVGRSSRGRYGSVGMSTGSHVQTYDQGTLLIDFTDVTHNKLVWRGTSTQSVSEHSNPEKSTEVINKTVEKILLQFPPQMK